MTTLGSLSVGLLVLALVAAVGIAVLARRRRRSSRGPEQPRTVADLVKMREAAAQAEAQAGGEASETASAAAAEPSAGSEPADEPTEVVATEQAAPEDASPRVAAESEAEAGEAPDPAPPLTTPASLQDTPWARAARMADPQGEWTASARAAREREATSGPRPVPSVAPQRPAPAKPPIPPSRPHLSLLHADRPGHETTTITRLPPALAQSVAGSPPPVADATATPAEQPPAAEAMPQQVAEAPAEAAAVRGEQNPADGATLTPSAPQQDAEIQAASHNEAAPVSSAPQQAAETPPAAQAASAVSVSQVGEVPAASAEEATLTAAAPQQIGEEPAGAALPPAVEEEQPHEIGSDPSDPSDEVTGPIVLPMLPHAQGRPAEDETVAIGRGFGAAPTVDRTQGFAAQPPGPTRPMLPDEPTARFEPLGSAPADAVRLEVGASGADDVEDGGGSAPQDGETPFGEAPVEPAVAPVDGHAVAANGAVLAPARVAGRARRSPADTAAEQAAADLALLRTFGVAGPGHTAAADDTEIALEGCGTDDAEPSGGVAQPVSFRVVGRDGRALAGASVTLLDDHGREIAGTVGDEHGAGTLTARRPGGYMLVTAAAGYQPGAVAIAVSDAVVDAEIPLTRSASIAGSVGGVDGPIVGAQLVLVQDGEIIETAESGADGAYRFADLAAGEYGLSVSACEWEPAAVVLRLIDEVDLRHDIDLDPAGLSAGGATGDVMIGHR